MNQTQVKYAKTRLEELLKQKQASLKEKFTTKGVSLSPNEKVEALKKGRFSVKDEQVRNWNWYGLIDFGETHDVFDNVGYRDAEDVLLKKFRSIMDELIIGDNDIALVLIKEFETT